MVPFLTYILPCKSIENFSLPSPVNTNALIDDDPCSKKILPTRLPPLEFSSICPENFCKDGTKLTFIT